MILRLWHGRTTRDKADAYEQLLRAKAIPGYRAIAGNIEASILRRDESDVTHFITSSLWTSEEAIRGFAGEDVLRAHYYPEDQDFLLEFEPLVQHYVVVASERAPR